MRRLLVEVWYDLSHAQWYKGYEDLAPKEFLWDLALKNTSRSRKKLLPILYNIDNFMEMMEEEGEKEMAQQSDQEGASDKP